MTFYTFSFFPFFKNSSARSLFCSSHSGRNGRTIGRLIGQQMVMRVALFPISSLKWPVEQIASPDELAIFKRIRSRLSASKRTAFKILFQRKRKKLSTAKIFLKNMAMKRRSLMQGCNVFIPSDWPLLSSHTSSPIALQKTRGPLTSKRKEFYSFLKIEERLKTVRDPLKIDVS